MPQYDDHNSEQNKFKVKLVDPEALTLRDRSVVFEVTPGLSENGSVRYDTIDLPHGPGQLFVYSGSTSRTFRITATFVSRTTQEATRNLARINLIRSWTKPVFGSNAVLTGETLQRVSPTLDANTRAAIQENARTSAGGDVLGAPPRVLKFSAYSDAMHRGMLFNIPTVILDYEIDYPEDVDYVPTGNLKGFEDVPKGTPVPVMYTVGLTLAESQSPSSFSRFNLRAYRLGILDGF